MCRLLYLSKSENMEHIISAEITEHMCRLHLCQKVKALSHVAPAVMSISESKEHICHLLLCQ